MKTKPAKYSIIFILSIVFLIGMVSCSPNSKEVVKPNKMLQQQSKALFEATMEKHLKAVSDKDLEVLSSTMSPTGKMQLILPGSEIKYTVDKFIDYHREWFKDTTAWSFDTEILNVVVGEQLGIAITEIVYREPERNGKPYFNRMIVSYALEKQDGKWYIIKDHASSIEKSTDKK